MSAAFAWEIATKHRLGKLNAAPLAADFVAEVGAEGFEVLSITAEHAQLAGDMVGSHGNPFDRMLMAQSLVTGMRLVSNEVVSDEFGVTRFW